MEEKIATEVCPVEHLGRHLSHCRSGFDQGPSRSVPRTQILIVDLIKGSLTKLIQVRMFGGTFWGHSA